jgi:hypothetical protein
LVTNNNETAYREEVIDLTMWCKDNNLSLNVIKTKEMIVEKTGKGGLSPTHSHRWGCSGAG